MAWLALYHFDDVGASTVADVSGNGYDIALTGTNGAQAAGLDTGAFAKTGANAVPLPAALRTAAETDDRSIMFDALGTRSVWWVRWNDTVADTGTWGILSLDAANLITRARTQAQGSPTPVNSVIGALSASVRHNHAITYKRSTGVLARYYDGVLIGTQAFAAGTPLFVGAGAADIGEFSSTGPAIDNLRIADHCADAVEIASLAGVPVEAAGPPDEVAGTASGIGGGAGSATGVRELTGTASGAGGGVGTATGASEVAAVTGTAVGMGGGTGTAVGIREVLGFAAGDGGGFGDMYVPSAAPAAPVATIGSSGWGSLLAIVNEAKAVALDETESPPVACPHDGEPLLAGPDGALYCPFDGWRPD